MADPAPSLLVIALRIVGALLAVELLWIALHRHPELRRPSPFGMPAVLLSGIGRRPCRARDPAGSRRCWASCWSASMPPAVALAAAVGPRVVALPAVLGRGPVGSIAAGRSGAPHRRRAPRRGAGRAAGAAGARADRGDPGVARGGRLRRGAVGADGSAAGGSGRRPWQRPRGRRRNCGRRGGGRRDEAAACRRGGGSRSGPGVSRGRRRRGCGGPRDGARAGDRDGDRDRVP